MLASFQAAKMIVGWLQISRPFKKVWGSFNCWDVGMLWSLQENADGFFEGMEYGR